MAGPRDEGEPYDGGTWVDVGPDNHWRPSFEERSRSLVFLLVLAGALLLAAAVASVDDGDGDEVEAAATSTTAPPTTEPSTTSTTEIPAASLDGAEPPPSCEGDGARDGAPMRSREDSTILVLNGTPRAGHAGDTTRSLEARGYSSMPPGNASQRDTTKVEYLPGFCAEAERLSSELGIPDVEYQEMVEEPEDVVLGRAVLIVTLGRDSL